MDTTRAFFPKSGHFLRYSKKSPSPGVLIMLLQECYIVISYETFTCKKGVHELPKAVIGC